MDILIRILASIRPFSAWIAAAWAATILIVSSTPHIPTLMIHTQGSDIRLDYLIHFCEYGFLSLMSYLAFSGKELTMSVRRLSMITAALIVFAISEEFHQKIVPGRTFNPLDIMSNMAGISAALIFCILVTKERK